MRGSRAVAVALALALCVCLGAATGAGASEAVRLVTSFSPNRPGASTTITFGFTITSPNGQVPSPLRGVDLHLPAGIGLARNTLGLDVCEPVYLYGHGPRGCPENSRLGFGRAIAEVPYGPEVVQERAAVYAYRGLPENEHVTVLFFAEGWTPVFADLVFPGQLLEDSGPFSGRIDTEVPLITSVPGGPDVSVVYFQSTFGPRYLTYHHRVHGRTVAFRPRGVTVPLVCPRGGFPFAADFVFQDGVHLTAHSAAPCPRGAKRRVRHGGSATP